MTKIHKIGRWMGSRFWESRQFYSAYIALFISVSNWITIQYRLVLENVPFLNSLFSNIWRFIVVASIMFLIISIFGGHYIHRKRQFRLENALATEENPYLYLAAPGKERDLMIPLYLLQLGAIEELLKNNNSLTVEKKNQFQKLKEGLETLTNGQAIGGSSSDKR